MKKYFAVIIMSLVLVPASSFAATTVPPLPLASVDLVSVYNSSSEVCTSSDPDICVELPHSSTYTDHPGFGGSYSAQSTIRGFANTVSASFDKNYNITSFKNTGKDMSEMVGTPSNFPHEDTLNGTAIITEPSAKITITGKSQTILTLHQANPHLPTDNSTYNVSISGHVSNADPNTDNLGSISCVGMKIGGISTNNKCSVTISAKIGTGVDITPSTTKFKLYTYAVNVDGVTRGPTSTVSPVPTPTNSAKTKAAALEGSDSFLGGIVRFFSNLF